MRSYLGFAAAVATILIASPALAATNGGVTATLDTTASGVPAGNTLIADFDTSFGGYSCNSSSGCQVLDSTIPNVGSSVNGSAYLAVFGPDGQALFNFANPFASISFDLGSLDSYNSFALTLTNGGTALFGGNDLGASGLSGLATFTADAGLGITSLAIRSTTNSAEIDNVSGAVPEPATWAMMLLGFGAVGFAMRRKHAAVLARA